MAATSEFLEAFIDQLQAFGVSRQTAALRAADDGEVRALGASSLEVRARPWPDGADADALSFPGWPAAHEGYLMTTGTVHRRIQRGHVHADLHLWTSDSGDERTLDLHATVEHEGSWFALRVFSNSADFAKDLGRDLPEEFSWDKLLVGFQRFAGTPPVDDWELVPPPSDDA